MNQHEIEKLAREILRLFVAKNAGPGDALSVHRLLQRFGLERGKKFAAGLSYALEEERRWLVMRSDQVALELTEEGAKIEAATLPAERLAKELLRLFVARDAQPGDTRPLHRLLQHFGPGRGVEFAAGLNFALEHGWLGISSDQIVMFNGTGSKTTGG